MFFSILAKIWVGLSISWCKVWYKHFNDNLHNFLSEVCNKGSNSTSNKIVCCTIESLVCPFYFTCRMKYGWKSLILIGIFQTSHTIQNWPNVQENKKNKNKNKNTKTNTIPNALPSNFPPFFLNGHTSLCISYSNSK